MQRKKILWGEKESGRGNRKFKAGTKRKGGELGREGKKEKDVSRYQGGDLRIDRKDIVILRTKEGKRGCEEQENVLKKKY